MAKIQIAIRVAIAAAGVFLASAPTFAQYRSRVLPPYGYGGYGNDIGAVLNAPGASVPGPGAFGNDARYGSPFNNDQTATGGPSGGSMQNSY